MQLSSIRHAGQVRSRGFSCREVGATPEAGSYPVTPLRLGQLGFAFCASRHSRRRNTPRCPREASERRRSELHRTSTMTTSKLSIDTRYGRSLRAEQYRGAVLGPKPATGLMPN